ncbi:MAG TPA: hypothetical protein VMU56_00680 [Beijerinckiaceae bacterium]|nr:hypothetical protein [Beijerinckiaceae bacterium]
MAARDGGASILAGAALGATTVVVGFAGEVATPATALFGVAFFDFTTAALLRPTIAATAEGRLAGGLAADDALEAGRRLAAALFAVCDLERDAETLGAATLARAETDFPAARDVLPAAREVLVELDLALAARFRRGSLARAADFADAIALPEADVLPEAEALAEVEVLADVADFADVMVLLRPLAARVVLAADARFLVTDREFVAERDFVAFFFFALLPSPALVEAAFERFTLFLPAIRVYSSACPALETGRAAGPTGPGFGESSLVHRFTRWKCGSSADVESVRWSPSQPEDEPEMKAGPGEPLMRLRLLVRAIDC